MQPGSFSGFDMGGDSDDEGEAGDRKKGGAAGKDGGGREGGRDGGKGGQQIRIAGVLCVDCDCGVVETGKKKKESAKQTEQKLDKQWQQVQVVRFACCSSWVAC